MLKKYQKKIWLTKRIIAVASGGGHLAELQQALPESILDRVCYVTYKNGHTKKSLEGKPHHFIIDPHISKIKYFINLLQSIFYYLWVRPETVISTGAGIAIPLILIGKLFGSRIIFIETGARVSTASKSGLFAYRYADLFIVQYKKLLKIFPKAVLGSLK